MNGLLFGGALVFLLIGHFFRIKRWEMFISIYERPSAGVLLKSMSLGYAMNFFLPFRLGDAFRAAYSGSQMKNGIGFSVATIILDRFLDVLAVALIFMIFMSTGIQNPLVMESMKYYIVATAVLFVCFVLLKCFETQVKKAVQRICALFNDNIKLYSMKFFWILINAFKDLMKLNKTAVLCCTIFMWMGYLVSYTLFALYLSQMHNPRQMAELFALLFSRSSLDTGTIGTTNILGTPWTGQWISMILYMLLPIALMYLVTLLPQQYKLKIRKKFFASLDETEVEYLNILPQIENQDQLQFLDNYFNSYNKKFLEKFIEMNRGISILRDYSAGSNATTMLCMNKEKTFYRKYALSEDGEKLKQQLLWLKEHQETLPVCMIMQEEFGNGYCCYDMEYNSNAIGMFRYLHSHPIANSKEILKSVMDTLRKQLYTRNCRKSDEKKIEEYLRKKVDENLESLKSSRQIKDLLSYKEIIINGKKYKNLPELLHLFNHSYLKKIFTNDSYCDIHGDLTIENIICLNDEVNLDRAYYIIDPNAGNIHDSQFLDFGKLLQSLHGGYEFLMMTKSVIINENIIDFMYTRSSTYDDMFIFLKEYLNQNFLEESVISIFHHELIHWLRLMPYKIRKDKKRAAIFYAGLVMIANDVDKWYYKK